MKNGNTPAAPSIDYQTHNGLTKREYMATHVLAGLVDQNSCTRFIESEADKAVEFTDALLKKLDEKVLCPVLQKMFDKFDEIGNDDGRIQCRYIYNDGTEDLTANLMIPTDHKTRNEVIDDIESRSQFVKWI